MEFLKKQKGQGAMEYLLLIGATILIAVTVIILIINMNQSNRENVLEQDASLGKIFDNTLIPPIVTNIDCISGGVVRVNIVESGKYSGYKIKVGSNEPYPSGNSLLIPNENGVLVSEDTEAFPSAGNLGLIDDVGTRYEISVVAIKNNLYSRPSTPSSSCVLSDLIT